MLVLESLEKAEVEVADELLGEHLAFTLGPYDSGPNTPLPGPWHCVFPVCSGANSAAEAIPAWSQ